MSSPPEQSPRAVLEEGLNRARHITVAAVMIVYLLARLLLVKIIWARVQIFLTWVGYHLARWLLRLSQWFLPHWTRLKQLAIHTTHRGLRLVLNALIQASMPVERLLLRLGVVLKGYTERAALQGAMTLTELLRALFGAISAFLAAGFNRPAARRLVLRLSELLEEAQR
jgi:hypothetical protein